MYLFEYFCCFSNQLCQRITYRVKSGRQTNADSQNRNLLELTQWLRISPLQLHSLHPNRLLSRFDHVIWFLNEFMFYYLFLFWILGEGEQVWRLWCTASSRASWLDNSHGAVDDFVSLFLISFCCWDTVIWDWREMLLVWNHICCNYTQSFGIWPILVIQETSPVKYKDTLVVLS